MTDEASPRPGIRWLEFILCALAASVGLAMFLVGSGLAAPSQKLLGGNLPINPGAIDPRDVSSNNSPSVARNPVDSNNLVAANRIDTIPFSCALYFSLRGGSDWTQAAIPYPAGEELPRRCFAPDVAFGADGTLYFTFVTLAGLGNNPNALWLSTSRDGGRTLSIPTRISGTNAFQSRITADPHRPGRIYVTWIQASATGNLRFASDDNPVLLTRSDDGGGSWSTPVRVNTPARHHVLVPSGAVSSGGDVYVLFLDVGDDRLDYFGTHEGLGGPPYAGTWQLILARSTNQGNSWREQVVERAVVPTERFISLFPPFPSLALDERSTRVYVAFTDGRLGDADVWLWASADGGSSFASPVRVNDTRAGDGTAQYLPRLAVAPDGRLDVVYYDRRSDPKDVMNEVSLQSSGDGGKTFSPRVRLSDRAFDPRIGFGQLRHLTEIGSRLALLSTDGGSLAVWTDTRAGTEASLKQDLVEQVVVLSKASPLRDPLRIAGPVVAGIGLIGMTALVALWVRARSRAARIREN